MEDNVLRTPIGTTESMQPFRDAVITSLTRNEEQIRSLSNQHQDLRGCLEELANRFDCSVDLLREDLKRDRELTANNLKTGLEFLAGQISNSTRIASEDARNNGRSLKEGEERLNRELEGIEKKVTNLNERIGSVENKVWYDRGLAAGIGAAIGWALSFIKK